MIFEFDLGNSRLKWRLVDAEGGLVATGAAPARADAMAATIAELPAPRRVRGDSVASAQLTQAWLAAVQVRWGLQAELAQSGSSCAGVSNGYREPQRLGADRWLALVAAYKQYQRAVLVVDAGSALTLDLVDDQGQHKGGYIVPGRSLLSESLQLATAGVRFDQVPELASIAPGNDTAGAVSNGSLLALFGTVIAAVAQSRSVLGADFEVVLTGGDGKWLQMQLEQAGEVAGHYCADLVLDGLRWVVP